MNHAPFPNSPQAAALHYDEAHDHAPRIVAKGKGEVAEQIIRRALEAGVPLIESEALVKALIQVDLDTSIPPRLYLAVAEILAWVYRLDGEAQQQISKTKGT